MGVKLNQMDYKRKKNRAELGGVNAGNDRKVSFFEEKFCRIRKKSYLCTRKSPDGGIGRRAGLKHQWGNPSRFDPGSGYRLKG